MTRKEIIAYLSGFFDGEGCIRIRKNAPRKGHSGCFDLTLSACQRTKHKEPLLMLQAAFGGWVGSLKIKKGSPMSRWQITGAKAAAAVDEMLPYLIVKRDHAIISLLYHGWKQENRKMRRYGEPLSLDEITTSDTFVKLFSHLNKRSNETSSQIN